MQHDVEKQLASSGEDNDGARWETLHASFPHDPIKDQKFDLRGATFEAAARWAKQMCDAGALVYVIQRNRMRWRFMSSQAEPVVQQVRDAVVAACKETGVSTDNSFGTNDLIARIVASHRSLVSLRERVRSAFIGAGMPNVGTPAPFEMVGKMADNAKAYVELCDRIFAIARRHGIGEVGVRVPSQILDHIDRAISPAANACAARTPAADESRISNVVRGSVVDLGHVHAAIRQSHPVEAMAVDSVRDRLDRCVQGG